MNPHTSRSSGAAVARRLVLLLALLALPGCNRGGEAPESAAGPAAGEAGSGVAPQGTADFAVHDSAAAAPVAEEPPAGAAQPASGIPTMLIRTGTATIEVDSLEPALARVRAMAQQAGGYVASTSIESGKAQRRTATLELKIPNARFDQVTSALAPVGKIEGLEVTTQNVGEEYVDVAARMANARRLEARLIELLANRTGKLQDVLEVERELARVREQIERFEGRLRYLRTQVAMSTLIVTVHEPAPLLEPRSGPSPIVEAFRQSWRNFVGFLAGMIAAMGVLIPLGALVALAWWATRRVRDRMAPRVPPARAERRTEETVGS